MTTKCVCMFGSVSGTVHRLSDVPPHPTLSVVALNFPTTHAEFIKVFREHIQANPTNPNKKRLAVIVSIRYPGRSWWRYVKLRGFGALLTPRIRLGKRSGSTMTWSARDFWVKISGSVH